MRCPVCWADKAYLRPVPAWQRALLRCVLLLPLKCQHCYHTFLAFWPLCLGKRLRPPPLRLYQPSVDTPRQSWAAGPPATEAARLSRPSKAA